MKVDGTWFIHYIAFDESEEGYEPTGKTAEWNVRVDADGTLTLDGFKAPADTGRWNVDDDTFQADIDGATLEVLGMELMSDEVRELGLHFDNDDVTYLLHKVEQAPELPNLLVAYGDFRHVTRDEPEGGWQHFFNKSLDAAAYAGAVFPERNVVMPGVNGEAQTFFVGFELPWKHELSNEDVNCRAVNISTIADHVGLNWIHLDDAAYDLGEATPAPFEDADASSAPQLWMLAEQPRSATLLFGSVVYEPAHSDDPDVQVYQFRDKWVAGVPVAELDGEDHRRLVVPGNGRIDVNHLLEFLEDRSPLQEKVNACLTTPRPTEGYLWKEKWWLILVEPTS